MTRKQIFELLYDEVKNYKRGKGRSTKKMKEYGLSLKNKIDPNMLFSDEEWQAFTILIIKTKEADYPKERLSAQIG